MLRIATLLVGGAIGAGIAMLLSPRNGEETRRELTNRLNDRYGDQIEKGRIRATELMQTSREMFDERLAQGQDLVNTALEKARTTLDDVAAAARDAAPKVDRAIEDAERKAEAIKATNADSAELTRTAGAQDKDHQVY